MARAPDSVIKNYRAALRGFITNLRSRVKLVLDDYTGMLDIKSMSNFMDDMVSAVRFVLNSAKNRTRAVITNIVNNAEYHAKIQLKRLFGEDAEFFAPLPSDVLGIVELSYDNELERMGIDLQESIKRTIRNSVMEGLNINQITTLLTEVYKKSWTDAERIARTETVRLWSMLMEERYKQMGVIEFVWVTSGGSKVCSICRPLHEKKFKIGEDIKLNNGKTVKRPPAHPNCRCGTRVVPP